MRAYGTNKFGFQFYGVQQAVQLSKSPNREKYRHQAYAQSDSTIHGYYFKVSHLEIPWSLSPRLC